MTNALALDDYEVDMIRDLYDEPERPRFWTVDRLAEKFDVSVPYVWKIITCKRRYRDPDQYG